MQEKRTKKLSAQERGYSKILPSVFAALALVLMLLPLEGPINSLRAVLSYVFIPQLRAAHGAMEYLNGAQQSARSLLEVATENNRLKEQISELQVQNSRAAVLEKENERLTELLLLNPQEKWGGLWARVAYREPSRRSTVIVVKGADDGIELRAPAGAIEDGVFALAGNVIEVTPKTAKILLLNDEEFFSAAYVAPSMAEGLVGGTQDGLVTIKYLPLGAQVKEGDKIFASASSALFPDGLLIGEIGPAVAEEEGRTPTSLSFYITPAAKPSDIKEVLIFPAGGADKKIKAGKAKEDLKK